MTAALLIYGLPVLVAAITGAAASGLTAWKLRRREPAAELVADEPETDPFIDAECDLASVHWAETNNLPPEAAELLSARLKTLHKIGMRKGWFE